MLELGCNAQHLYNLQYWYLEIPFEVSAVAGKPDEL